MGMPVKLSDALVETARAEAARADRSITAQIEHWAKIGRAVESTLQVADVLDLKSGGENVRKLRKLAAERKELIAALQNLMSNIDVGATRTRIFATGKPVYGSDPNHPGMIVRVSPDGSRTLGYLRNRRFVAAKRAQALAGRA